MNKDNRPYFNAAMYYMDNGKDLNQALAWFNKALEQKPKRIFYPYHQKPFACQSWVKRRSKSYRRKA